MGRLLEVDWEELGNVASGFQNNANSLSEVKNSYTDILNSLDTSWKGVDEENFKLNSEELIRELENEISYLTVWNSFLIKSSEKYSDGVNTFLMKFNEIEAELGE